METTTPGSHSPHEKRIDNNLQTAPKDLDKYSNAITPLISTTLQIHPACLEFAPANIGPKYPEVLRTKAREYFVVGTYQLAEELKENEGKKAKDGKHQERIGGLSLFRLQNSGTELYWVQDILREYGVYEIKFLPCRPIFAAATTVGRIVIFQLKETPDHSGLQIEEISSHLVFPETIIISIAWFPRRSQDGDPQILAITVESGGVYLIQFDATFASYELMNEKAPLHEHVYKTPFFENKLQVWSCAFSFPIPDTVPPHLMEIPNTVFSGGDDNCLRSSTWMTGDNGIEGIENDEPCQALLFLENEKVEEKFPAGITSILELPIYTSSYTRILLIGCYDNHLRLCRISYTSSTARRFITYGSATFSYATSSARPSLTTFFDLDLGGGVYRLKHLLPFLQPPFDPTQEITSFTILACCMHAGTKIIQLDRKDAVWSVEVLGEVKDNTSMCYAADIQPLPEDGQAGQQRIGVSSSWADSKITVWRYDEHDA